MRHLSRMTVLGTGLLLVTAGCAQHSQPATSTRAGTTTTTIPSGSGTPVTVTAPAGSSSTSNPTGAVHHVVTGEITDVDRNSGKVDIRSADGSKVQVVLPPLAVATTNKGDRASIDVKIGPAR